MTPAGLAFICSFAFVLLFSYTVHAENIFWPNGTFVPDTAVSHRCTSALQEPVRCSSDVLMFATSNSFFPIKDPKHRAAFCNPTCGQDLQNYIADVDSACAKDPKPFNDLPASYFGSFALATGTLNCTKDPKTDESCISYFFDLFADSQEDTRISSVPNDKLWTDCTYLFFQQLQRTHFSNYKHRLVEDWTHIQSRCKVSYPTEVQQKLVVNNMQGFASPNATYSTRCYTGSRYTVRKDDTVQSIAQNRSVATGALVTLNGLLKDGSDLKSNRSLCLPQKCPTYIVKKGDTCREITDGHKISFPGFVNWNPSINTRCTNLIPGQSVCVGPPGGAWRGSPISNQTASLDASVTTATVAYGSTPVAGLHGRDSNHTVARRAPGSGGGMAPRHPGVHYGYDRIVDGLAVVGTVS